MKVSRVGEKTQGWEKFDLNVGGFTIRSCRWRARTRQVLFPRRYNQNRRSFRVVQVRGAHVARLQNLLELGLTRTPRDRRPCKLGVRFLGQSQSERRRWIIFGFTVRGFTILGCRWQPDSGSVQLPVTYMLNDTGPNVGYARRLVVCAYGAHIVRLRRALEAKLACEKRLSAEEIGQRAQFAQEASDGGDTTLICSI